MANQSALTKALLTCVVAHTAILHNGKRYDVNDEILLTEAEYHRLAVYVTLKDADALKKAKAEAEAKAQALAAQAKAEEEAKAEADAKTEAEKTNKKEK
ncbi:hypothetical protein QV09_09655 [Gallibacterium salpingitidis]|uniref:DUF7210 domain-containing protein n=1 Tax=Gallibacterium salpingitidis TaxID=505341 RepID=A0AB36E0W8_9PAST|nr:hypothetical protein [Gallibacterium salpingitidis]OBX08347.1 hypothetical protein QV09_09655 [Gallibacterium salpingitidis]